MAEAPDALAGALHAGVAEIRPMNASAFPLN
jgi:hypothetical protein